MPAGAEPSRAGLLQGALRPAKMRLVGGRLVLRRQTSGALSIAMDGMTDLQGTVPEQARRLRDGDAVSLRGNVTILGAREHATWIEVNYAGAVGSRAAEFGFRFEDMPARDIAGQSPALVWLSALDAPISGALRAAVDAAGQLGPVNVTLQIGAGALQPNPDTTPIPFDAARSYFSYHPDAQEIRFSELSADSSWGRARSEGTARLVGIEDGWPRELQAQFTFDEIVTDPADLYPDPVGFEGASTDLSLRLDPFELTMGAVHLADQGRMLRLAAAQTGQLDVTGRLCISGPSMPGSA